MLQPRRNAVFILTESSRQDTGQKYQHNTGNIHVTGETDQGVLAAVYIYVSRVSRAHPAHRSMHEQ